MKTLLSSLLQHIAEDDQRQPLHKNKEAEVLVDDPDLLVVLAKTETGVEFWNRQLFGDEAAESAVLKERGVYFIDVREGEHKGAYWLSFPKTFRSKGDAVLTDPRPLFEAHPKLYDAVKEKAIKNSVLPMIRLEEMPLEALTKSLNKVKSMYDFWQWAGNDVGIVSTSTPHSVHAGAVKAVVKTAPHVVLDAIQKKLTSDISSNTVHHGNGFQELMMYDEVAHLWPLETLRKVIGECSRNLELFLKPLTIARFQKDHDELKALLHDLVSDEDFRPDGERKSYSRTQGSLAGIAGLLTQQHEWPLKGLLSDKQLELIGAASIHYLLDKKHLGLDPKDPQVEKVISAVLQRAPARFKDLEALGLATGKFREKARFALMARAAKHS